MQPIKLLFLVVFIYTSPSVLSAQIEAIQKDVGVIKVNIQPTFDSASNTPELTGLKERMAALNIPAVSIAFMENHKITWTLTEGVIDFVSQRKIDKNTLFQTASSAKPELATVLLKYRKAQNLELNANTLPKLTQSRAVTLRPLLTHSRDTAVNGFRTEGVQSAVMDVIKATNLSYSKTTSNALNMEEHSASIVPVIEETAKNVAEPHRSIGISVEGTTSTYASVSTNGLWTTPSDLLRLASKIQQSHDSLNNFMEKQEGNVSSFTDGILNDGFSTNLFIHKLSGHGVAIMTNSDNGDELVDDLLSIVTEVYGWNDFNQIEKTAAVLEPELPEPFIVEPERLIVKPEPISAEPEISQSSQSNLLEVAEGEQF